MVCFPDGKLDNKTKFPMKKGGWSGSNGQFCRSKTRLKSNSPAGKPPKPAKRVSVCAREYARAGLNSV